MSSPAAPARQVLTNNPAKKTANKKERDSMKAAVCTAFGQPLVIEEVEIDPPQQGEVKVKVAACAICHSDILYMDGAWGGALPAIYGHEAAGVVEEIGTGVTDLEVGDHVVVSLLRNCGSCFHCARGESHACEGSYPIDEDGRLHRPNGERLQQGLRTGAFAEYVVVDRSQVVAVPKNLPLDSASLLACGVITGLGAVVNTAQVAAGESVVVIGAGGVGLNSVQGAALSGAEPIIALDVAEEKLSAAKDFGATHGINARDPDVRDQVLALTGGRGADYVFVTVGNTKAMEQGLSLIRSLGNLVVVGMAPIGSEMKVDPLELGDRSQRIVGSKMGSTQLQVDVPKLIELYEQNRLKLDELISGRYPLQQINDAIDSVRRAEALRNVIVF